MAIAPQVPRFDRRHDGPEMMDAPNAPDAELRAALRELPRINRWLGGYRATLLVLDRLSRSESRKSLKILDVGTGIGDYAYEFVRWGMRKGIDVSVEATDLSERIIDFAVESARSWAPAIRERVSFRVADARALSYEAGTFDVVTAALFFHHLSDSEAVIVLEEMSRLASIGLVVNDIHRCPPAYHGIRALTRTLGFSEMVRHDGPISVLRSFSRGDLERIGRAASIEGFSLEWRWAFRWILTNIPRQ